MPKYLFTGSYTAEGGRGVLAEGGSRRVSVVDQLCTSVGGSLESYHFAFGSDDYFIIANLPDNVTAAAVGLTVSATGAVQNRTIVLLTPAEVDAATKLSPTYRPPGR